jgi:hypothetical protein
LPIKDRTGRRYGHLVVQSIDTRRETLSGNVRWMCLCDCGTSVSIRGTSLGNGTSNSCGCARIELHSAAFDRRRAEKDYFSDFMTRIRKTRGCWYWTGAVNGLGYGLYQYKGRTVRAHRLSYEFAGLPLRDDQVLCHKCDNPICVKPGHLFPGTQADNVADMHAKGRNYSGPSKLAGMLHPLAKIDEDAARKIRAEIGSCKEIAARYGVSKSLVYGIKRGTHWKYA